MKTLKTETKRPIYIQATSNMITGFQTKLKFSTMLLTTAHTPAEGADTPLSTWTHIRIHNLKRSKRQKMELILNFSSCTELHPEFSQITITLTTNLMVVKLIHCFAITKPHLHPYKTFCNTKTQAQLFLIEVFITEVV